MVVFTSSPSLSLTPRVESLEDDVISKGVKLIVVDSVASVVRKEFDPRLEGNLAKRSNLLSSEAATLKYLAEEFSIPVSLGLFSVNKMIVWIE